jgi:protein phosphatase
VSLQVNYTVTSHQGLVRGSNEDIIEAFVISKMDTTGAALRIQGIIVCDGMGGMKAGETASRLASISVIDYINAMPFWPSLESDINQQLSDAIISAHQNITMLSEYDYDKNGMGTTIVLLLMVKNQAHILWSGDSRAYLLTSRTIDQGINAAGIHLLTRDHSVSWDMVAKGILTVDQARNHPQSHALTQSLGGIQPPKPDHVSLTVEDGDRFMLCTDGVYLHLDSTEIKTCLRNHNDLELAAQTMTNLILERGAKDNFSIGILDVVKVQFVEPVLKVSPLTHQQNQSKNTNHWFKWWWVFPILFILGGVVYGIWTKFKHQITQTETSLQPKHPLIASKENHERNQIKLNDAMLLLGQKSQQLQDITDQMARSVTMDTLVKNIDEDRTVASVNPATIVTQKPLTKAVVANTNKLDKPTNKKPLHKEKARLYDDIYNDVIAHITEYTASHQNTDIYQQAYMIRLEQLLIEIKEKRNSNDYTNSMKINWQLEYLRNKFDKIQSKYKPE